jgi:ribose-phosphate pyrophosphokinase
MSSKVKLFAGRATQYLAKKIADEYGKPLGKFTIEEFSDGEIQPSFQESIRGDNVFIIQSTFAPSTNIMELLLTVDAAKRASAKHIVVAIPYFGYARQDRKDKPRVSIGAKLLANLLTAAGANRIMTIDLHAAQIQGFFDIPLDHLDATYIFMPYLEKLNLNKLVFASPDVGGTARARTYANYFDAGLVICDKYRPEANQVGEMTIIGDVENKNVVLVDDIVDTAGTLTSAANKLKDQGAKSVRACITHPVLSGDAYDKIKNSSLTELAVSDTLPLEEDIYKIKTISCAELFAKAIRHAHEYKSIDSLFIIDKNQ